MTDSQRRGRVVSLAGINGERAEAIMRTLEYGPASACDILRSIRKDGNDEDRDLFRVAGGIETVQAVLRAMEVGGDVYRTKRGREHIWELPDAD